MSGERVIKTTNENVDHCTDPITKFPISSEKDLMKDRTKSTATTSSTSTASRNINFTGEGFEVLLQLICPFSL